MNNDRAFHLSNCHNCLQFALYQLEYSIISLPRSLPSNRLSAVWTFYRISKQLQSFKPSANVRWISSRASFLPWIKQIFTRYSSKFSGSRFSLHRSYVVKKNLEQLEHNKLHYQSVYWNAETNGKVVLRFHLKKLILQIDLLRNLHRSKRLKMLSTHEKNNAKDSIYKRWFVLTQ